MGGQGRGSEFQLCSLLAEGPCAFYLTPRSLSVFACEMGLFVLTQQARYKRLNEIVYEEGLVSWLGRSRYSKCALRCDG